MKKRQNINAAYRERERREASERNLNLGGHFRRHALTINNAKRHECNTKKLRLTTP